MVGKNSNREMETNSDSFNLDIAALTSPSKAVDMYKSSGMEPTGQVKTVMRQRFVLHFINFFFVY